MGLYDDITNRIVQELDNGTVPWRKPWTNGRRCLTCAPVNGVTNRPYRGINRLVLGMSEFSDNRWMTFRQVKEVGGSVKRGSKGMPVVYWRFPDDVRKDEDEEQENSPSHEHPVAIRYIVFNAEQCYRLLVSDGGKLPDLKPAAVSVTDDAGALEAVRRLLETMPDAPEVKLADQAAYCPRRDIVYMPNQRSFDGGAAWASTLAHELCHSTGHQRRLNRLAVTGTVMFGSNDYSEEELVAELGACFICAELGIRNDIANSASYIDCWRQRISKDHSLIIRTASHAQRAADYILNRPQ